MKKLFFVVIGLAVIVLGIYAVKRFHEQWVFNQVEVKVEGKINTTKPPTLTKPEKELPGGWELVWDDEFNDATSLKKWTVMNWDTQKNNELQYYSPKNVTVRDGNLIITAKKEQMGSKSYTSGAITTADTFHMKYGKIEVRAKLPGGGNGIFPAMWLRAVHKQRYSPEIDFMEYIGSSPNEIHHAVHWYLNGKYYHEDSANLTASGIQEGYHTFGVEWDPDKVVFFIDGKKTFQAMRYSPNVEMYLYLNLAIGGDWPGAPTPDVVFPREMKVDYVRVYKMK